MLEAKGSCLCVLPTKNLGHIPAPSGKTSTKSHQHPLTGLTPSFGPCHSRYFGLQVCHTPARLKLTNLENPGQRYILFHRRGYIAEVIRFHPRNDANGKEFLKLLTKYGSSKMMPSKDFIVGEQHAANGSVFCTVRRLAFTQLFGNSLAAQ